MTWPAQAADEVITPGGTATEVAGEEATGPEPATAEPESADLPLWDWSPPATEEHAAEEHAVEEPPAKREDPPKPVVTPVEEAEAGPGRRGGPLSHLSGNPRMRVWRLRALVAVVVMVVFSILANWKLGLTLAVIVVIADTIYRARKGYPGTVKMTAAQRHTRRQLAKLHRAGYRALNGSPIPDSEDQIDHLVIGPAMAVYGPKIRWDVATIREVDVFSGPRLRKYLRRRARNRDLRPLSDDEIERIFEAANKAFPHLSSASPAG